MINICGTLLRGRCCVLIHRSEIDSRSSSIVGRLLDQSEQAFVLFYSEVEAWSWFITRIIYSLNVYIYSISSRSKRILEPVTRWISVFLVSHVNSVAIFATESVDSFGCSSSYRCRRSWWILKTTSASSLQCFCQVASDAIRDIHNMLGFKNSFISKLSFLSDHERKNLVDWREWI